MIRLTQKDFLLMPYAIKSDRASTHKAEADMTRRTVDFVANTYYYYDSYGDVLVPGCCLKSIKDKGPKSELPGKIKHLGNHDLKNGIGRPDLIEETQLDGLEVLRFNSWMSETVNGENTLQKYIEGIIDQHSIGFRYLNLRFLEPESEDEDRRKRWDELLSLLVNPEEAVANGFMWEVKEIDLWEASSLDGFGANRLTPFLGVKSDNVNVQYNNLIAKLDALHSAMRSGGNKDIINLEERQIKQMIYELYNPEPDPKGTPRKSAGAAKKEHFDVDSAIKNLNIKI